MSRLVVLSNRVADLGAGTQSGGLAVALVDALRANGGIWLGWEGTASASVGAPRIETFGNVRKVSVDLAEADVADYYLGYSNSVLWPLLHYRLDLIAYKPRYFKAYRQVNARFADSVLPHVEPDDTIWVHDYHLMLVARRLRELGCRNRIGFFLHVPFPPPELLMAAPNHRAIVTALLAFDLVGFQTSVDLGNFLRYVALNCADVEVDGERITTSDRIVSAARFPIGIDVATFTEMAREGAEDVRIDGMRRALLGLRQIVGVDRLDYSKGIPDRLQAFERLLAIAPELQKSVTLLQVAPPTRQKIGAYDAIRQETEALAGAINGRFADFDWTPIRFLHRAVPRDKLAAIFRTSEVGLVTPLRDGMNLVAKEYVAAQDPADPGVLVLSQFAGAAEEMADALIVNPHDPDDMARALQRALTMPLAERRSRHAALLRTVEAYDVHAWATSFLDRLVAAAQNSVAPIRDAAA